MLTVRAIGWGAALLAFTVAATASGTDTLLSVAARYYAKAGQIATVTGRDSTMDYYQRLLDDAGFLNAPPPSYYTADQWQHSVQGFSQLDLSLARQLLAQSYQPMASIRGLGETFVRSSKDGTMQPVAVYVPPGYSKDKPAPLLVFLHGRLESESRLIAPQFIEDVADRTGTIVVAPYGRGYYDYRGSESDVYDAFDAANLAFTIDPHKRYLGGYSMGGFSVFTIAPMHPSDWTAVMCIAGSLLGSRSQLVETKLSNTKFYVLTGARDDTVPTLYPTLTAIFLRDAGIPVTFYSQSDGTHLLYSLRSILSQAWSDMEAGVVRTPEGLAGGGQGLPEAVP
jgi:S-formylglutathione hydrolase FrmB